MLEVGATSDISRGNCLTDTIHVNHDEIEALDILWAFGTQAQQVVVPTHTT